MPDPTFTRGDAVFISKPELDKRLADGLVTARPHPTFPLTIWNYTDVCTYSKSWDDYTRVCRGLVTTNAGDEEVYKVVARGFDKFFNVGEADYRGDGVTPPAPVALPDRAPDLILEKLDGSLGLCFRWFDGASYHLVWATRGAFGSVQAQAAERIAVAKYRELKTRIAIGETLLVEIIAPETSVVVQYDFEDLVFIGLRWTDGSEAASRIASWQQDAENFTRYGMPAARVFAPADVASLQSRARSMDATEEGFVCLWREGARYVRAKVKSAGYASVHRITQSQSTRAVADRWYAGEMDFLAILPPKLHAWATAAIDELETEAARLKTAVSGVVAQAGLAAIEVVGGDLASTRKAFAQAAKALCGDDTVRFGLVMSDYAGKPIDYRLSAYRRIYGNFPRAIEVVAPGEELID